MSQEGRRDTTARPINRMLAWAAMICLAAGVGGASPETAGALAAGDRAAGGAAVQQPSRDDGDPGAASEGQDFVERFSQVQDVEGVSLITVSNPFGDIRLRFGGREPTLEVAAAVQQLSKDGRRLEVTVKPRDDGTAVDVRVGVVAKGSAETKDPAGSPSTAEAVSRSELGQSRADVFVLVPAVGLAVHAEARDGLLECREVRADVELVTRAGTIDCREVTGRISATSQSGEINVVLEPGATDQPQHLQTTTGDITLFAADEADLDVTLTSSGELTTDFSIDIEHRDSEEPDKLATARVGAGGHVLEMLSKRGHLRLRRLLSPEGEGAGSDAMSEDGSVAMPSRDIESSTH